MFQSLSLFLLQALSNFHFLRFFSSYSNLVFRFCSILDTSSHSLSLYFPLLLLSLYGCTSIYTDNLTSSFYCNLSYSLNIFCFLYLPFSISLSIKRFQNERSKKPEWTQSRRRREIISAKYFLDIYPIWEKYGIPLSQLKLWMGAVRLLACDASNDCIEQWFSTGGSRPTFVSRALTIGSPTPLW